MNDNNDRAALALWREIAEAASATVVDGRKHLLLSEGMCVRLGAALEAASPEPKPAEVPADNGPLAAAIHWPECWDTAAYPTARHALAEVYEHFRCTQCTTPPQASAPAGWKLVPVEPTPEMIEAAGLGETSGSIRGAWADMLAAAPEAPEALTAGSLREPRNGEGWRVEWWNESMRMMLPDGKRLHRFFGYKNGTMVFTIKAAHGISGEAS